MIDRSLDSQNVISKTKISRPFECCQSTYTVFCVLCNCTTYTTYYVLLGEINGIFFNFEVKKFESFIKKSKYWYQNFLKLIERVYQSKELQVLAFHFQFGFSRFIWNIIRSTKVIISLLEWGNMELICRCGDSVVILASRCWHPLGIHT